MAVEALFVLDDSMVAQCNTHLYISVKALQNTVNQLYPLTIITHYFQLKMKEIVTEAQKLSLHIQQGFVTRRLFVTASLAPAVEDGIIGTNAFGLDRVSHDGRVMLVASKTLSISDLESFPDS
jgi:hypothetical protein